MFVDTKLPPILDIDQYRSKSESVSWDLCHCPPLVKAVQPGWVLFSGPKGAVYFFLPYHKVIVHDDDGTRAKWKIQIVLIAQAVDLPTNHCGAGSPVRGLFKPGDFVGHVQAIPYNNNQPAKFVVLSIAPSQLEVVKPTLTSQQQLFLLWIGY